MYHFTPLGRFYNCSVTQERRRCLHACPDVFCSCSCHTSNLPFPITLNQRLQYSWSVFRFQAGQATRLTERQTGIHTCGELRVPSSKEGMGARQQIHWKHLETQLYPSVKSFNSLQTCLGRYQLSCKRLGRERPDQAAVFEDLVVAKTGS